MPTFPSRPAPTALALRLVQPRFESRTHSGKRQVRLFGTGRLVMEATWAGMATRDVSPLWAFAAAAITGGWTFELVPEQWGYPIPAAVPATALASAGAAQGATAIQLTGLPDGPLFIGGEPVRFGADRKTYLVAAPVVAVDGAATLTVAPPLVRAVPAGSLAHLRNVALTVFVPDEEVAQSVSTVLHTLTLKFEESL
ncbi:hypothetical protein N8I74_11095 [Chitiniphilus purpureus]|uniref:Phage tail protein n=1 Tax=Chitiniphilus purpureus TaxID=2981137 RepID=A0ABY6DJJ7_9NEIS|nr:hypothetical protein [Chitiniphilus sp. CD1]UXY13868.1 hypothetical protein N8I74_11095 [Chitiniphilus sp. CD1]